MSSPIFAMEPFCTVRGHEDLSLGRPARPAAGGTPGRGRLRGDRVARLADDRLAPPPEAGTDRGPARLLAELAREHPAHRAGTARGGDGPAGPLLFRDAGRGDLDLGLRALRE